MPIAIRVEGVAKKYAMGRRREGAYDTLRDQNSRTARSLAGRVANPFSRASRPSGGAAAEGFWALRDISFELRRGERLGIIGRNGAGKSTLLKILSHIPDPTPGSVAIRDRVAGLLEVGTGFHPELTGRENIFLNGAILGMKRSELLGQLDEIVDFAEIDKFIDTPVKHYSSGMTVRLAFSVAAHLEPDLLIADEALALGDIAFQPKLLGKMGDATQHGRTFLFVSHDPGAVRNRCGSVLLIEQGRLKFEGAVEEGAAICEKGLSDGVDIRTHSRFQGPLSDRIRIHSLAYRQDGAIVTIVDPRKSVEIEPHGEVLSDFRTLDLSIALFRDGFHLGTCHGAAKATSMRKDALHSRFHLRADAIKPGGFWLAVGALASSGDWAWSSEVAVLDVAEHRGDDSAARHRGAMNLNYTSKRLQP